MTAYSNSIQQYGHCQLLTHATPYCKVASITSYTCICVCSSVLRAHLHLTVRESKGRQNCHASTGDQATNNMAIIYFSDTISVINTQYSRSETAGKF